MLIVILGLGVLYGMGIAWAKNKGEGGLMVLITSLVGVASFSVGMVILGILSAIIGGPNGPENADQVESRPLNVIESRDGTDYYAINDVDDEDYMIMYADKRGTVTAKDYNISSIDLQFSDETPTLYRSTNIIHNMWISPFPIKSMANYTMVIPEGGILAVGEHD